MAAAQTPSISGTNGMWYLNGIASDQGYYATQVLTLNPNGLTGTINYDWAGFGSGSINLSCFRNCSTSVTVTSLAASSGCTADVEVVATVGGVGSNQFFITVVTPTTTTLVSGPYDEPYPGYTTTGYESVYVWNLTDSCGNNDAGLDENEQFGTFTVDDSGETWGYPSAFYGYNSSYQITDQIRAANESTPASVPPSSNPCTPTTKVFEDSPWRYFVASLTNGDGVQVHSDTQIWYTNCGRHQ
jgi:hypothetical protein